jgi:hypothetical protein
MGIASILAVILVVCKAVGFTSLAWGWCVAGFGFDIVLAGVMLTLGYLFSKKGTKGANKSFDSSFMRKELNNAKDRLG